MLDETQDTKLSRRTFLAGAASTALVLGAAEALAQTGTPIADDATTATQSQPQAGEKAALKKPNILYIMTDQQRFDTIAALGNSLIYTPNLDRLVKRGVSFTQGYSTCPVCVPARYTIHTGCEPWTTGIYWNAIEPPMPGQAPTINGRCGPYLGETMKKMGYRTFGIGKFHTTPFGEDLGFETHLLSEELYGTEEIRQKDAYASFIAKEHPEYDWVDMLMGERSEMYYMPQMSPLPAALGVEAWAAQRAVEEIKKSDERPWFGFVSFIGPHPPLAPPQPFNRMYDPDRMPNPVRGELALDHMDDMLPWMNYALFSEDINDSHARVLKARYYGEISYIDQCLGHVLDAVEALPDADNTLICFFSDHGDNMGDHHAWQKETFFDSACRIPFLVSWPARLPRDQRRTDFVCLSDLFGIATSAAGKVELRDGVDVLGIIEGNNAPREHVIGCHGTPGTALFETSGWPIPPFKIMVREGDWKYIFHANGGQEQLFNLAEDPQEIRQRIKDKPEIAKRLRQVAVGTLKTPSAQRALDGADLKALPLKQMPRQRAYQFCEERGFTKFLPNPADAIKDVKLFEG